MKLQSLQAVRYRSLRDVTVPLGGLNVLIGANASGKSNVLDALRFLSTGVRDKDFVNAVARRGGVLSVAWKGQPAADVLFVTRFADDAVQPSTGATYEWTVDLQTLGFGGLFRLDEIVTEYRDGGPLQRLSSRAGRGWWYGNERVQLAQVDTACALAAAAADASFPARTVAEFVAGWGFFDPSPFMLRRMATATDDASRLDPLGSNLAPRLRALKESTPQVYEEILDATKRVLGVPEDIDVRETPDGHVYFVQTERGLQFTVHQVGASSGTLRMLALMTGLLGEPQSALVGIEEPENYVHPSALADFAEYLKKASERIQVIVTTHSPLLLDYIDDPSAVLIVRRGDEGTEVQKEETIGAVREALAESGFSLGEYLQTKGFGA